MALTITQQPSAYTPAYNNQWFTASSTQTAQPNFKYTAVITDMITGLSETYQIPADPNGLMVFDAMPFAESRVKNYMPLNGLNGFKLCTDALRQIKVNIGETYGAGTPTPHPGSDMFYYVWNACLSRKIFSTYNFNDYIYNNTVPNRRYFAGVLSDTAFTDRSSFLYVLTTNVGELPSILIKTYDASGTLLGNSTIANPFSATAGYTNRYVCIDVGYKGLNTIPSGSVTGVYPIITTAVASYEVVDNSGGAVIKTFTMGCENRYSVYAVHFLARNGGFGTCNFDMITNRNQNKETTTYKQNPNEYLSTGGYGYATESSVDKILDVELQDVLTLRTNWLTDQQISFYKECFSSPVSYLDIGATRYEGIRTVTNTYKDLPHYDSKLVRLQHDYNFNYTDGAQRP